MNSIFDNFEMQELIEEYGEEKILSIIKRRKSFCLYFDNFPNINGLSNEQAGILFKNIIAYESMQDTCEMDDFIKYAFSFIEPRLINGLVEYIKQSIANSINGSKGGKAKAEKQAESARPAPTEQEFYDFCDMKNIDRHNAEYYYNSFKNAGWKQGGKPIEDWQQHILKLCSSER